MPATVHPIELRRTPRKRANFTSAVTDTLNGQLLGYLGNLSAGGLMLISAQPPCSEAIYQLGFDLPGSEPAVTLELGVQAQWYAAAATPGQYWAGYRIIAISDEHQAALERWLRQPT